MSRVCKPVSFAIAIPDLTVLSMPHILVSSYFLNTESFKYSLLFFGNCYNCIILKVKNREIISVLINVLNKAQKIFYKPQIEGKSFYYPPLASTNQFKIKTNGFGKLDILL